MIKPPGHTQAVLAKHQVREAAKKKSLQILLNGQLISAEKYEEIAEVGIDPDASVKLAILQNDIQQTKDSLANPLPMKLDEQDKSEFDGRSKASYHRWVEDLKSKLGKVFSLIMGQCTQLLKYQMKHDPDWLTACKSSDPLRLYTLIEKTVLSQSNDCYEYATTYAHVYDLYKHTQAEGNLTNDKWYHWVNTKVDVGIAVGVTHQYPKLLDLEAKKLHNKEFALLDPITEQLGIREIAEERYLAYVFLQQSGSQHDQLQTDLLNDFSKGQNHYPQNRQEVLHRLNTYANVRSVSTASQSEGVAFAQGGGSGGRGRGRGGQQGNNGRGKSAQEYDKDLWKERTCYNCNKKGRPSNHCPLPKKKKADNSDALSALTNAVKEQAKSMANMQTMLDERSAADEA